VTRKVVNTYRLQLRREFSFDDARAVVPYLARLGVTHLYLSPILAARPGSAHGYDITDHRRLNEELGGEAGFEALAAEARAHGLGIVVDFVPNHMGIDPRTNPWWRDVLENGECSPYARTFDIDWRPIKPELRDRVLLPILGDRYGIVLERGELELRFAGGALSLAYFDHDLPIDPRQAPKVLRPALDRLDGDDAASLGKILDVLDGLPATDRRDAESADRRHREKEEARAALDGLCERARSVAAAIAEAVREVNGVAGEPATFDRLHELLEAQPYRLAYWRTALHEINYRRFFDVNDLAALRMEDPEVFAATHELVLRLLREGTIAGLRLDHVDGLLDPAAYLERLAAEAGGSWIVIEKILADGESLPEGWPIAGTTGYDFLNELNRLFVDGRNGKRLRTLYERFTRRTAPMPILLAVCKRLVTQTTLASELSVLAHRANRISERDRRSRDFTLDSLRDAIREVVAAFPVYRTYVSSRGASDADRRVVNAAIDRAASRNPLMERSIFDFVRGCLLAEGNGIPARELAERRDFAMRFQQYATAVQAKGVEDTAFYRHHALTSLCEVGGEPARFGGSVGEFHAANRRRRERWPHGMLATATHDTKRGEDARARIDVISEMPLDWGRAVTRWARMHTGLRSEPGESAAPDRNDEWLFYQTLVGVWPPEGASAAEDELVERIGAYLLKAAREAKLNTSWINPNERYEAALRGFVEGALRGRSSARFLESLGETAADVARCGALNSLDP
jgi:(1->4)-alpha-D-glucan 1-alpha-D-glucosylmutase